MTRRIAQSRIAPLALACSLLAPLGAPARADRPPDLPQRDAILIAEALHLWQSMGERVWPGWTRISMPVIYVTATHEYAIDFPTTLKDATPLATPPLLSRKVQARPRTLSPKLAASFDVEGVNAVVIGSPEAIGWNPTKWVLKAVHEMFHVLQADRGQLTKVAHLEIGPKDDASSWQLTFPFPYDDNEVMSLVHLQGYPLYLACTGPETIQVRYAAGTALEATRVLQATLMNKTGDERAYRYATFQQQVEGIALYTEYSMAELAAAETYTPLEDFRSLSDAAPYQEIWAEYMGAPFLVKHAGRAARSRSVFYHLGLGKGLVLDKLLPQWKNHVFAPTTWLNDLLAEAVGSHTQRDSLKVGDTAPSFDLFSLEGERFSQKTLNGSVVLLEFWQTWCPPCVDLAPHLKDMQRRFGDRGMRIIGVVDRLNASGEEDLRRFVRKHETSFPNLLDSTGDLARGYGVSGYPHLFVLDRMGKVRFARRGVIADEETGLEELINTLLSEPVS